jgi:ribonuclease HI
MSSNSYSLNNTRTYHYNSKRKQSKKKKSFHPKNKIYKVYSEEVNSPSTEKSEQQIEYDAVNENSPTNKYEIEIIYEDEYNGLIYYPRYPDIGSNNIYYYNEKDKSNEFNNFKTKWKTEICRYWEMYGECKFGDNCAFAHGDSELKQRKMTFNYKTKLCKQFFELGYCSYGSRCQFSHKREDLHKQKNENDNVSYWKIIEELLSEDSQVSHELVKRPRLMTFENIASCSLEESENSKLKLYEDIINLKNSMSKKEKGEKRKFKLSEDTNSNSQSEKGNDKEDF